MSDQFFDVKKNIVAVFGLGELPVEKRIELLEKINELVLKRVILRVVEEMGPEGAVKMDALKDKPAEMMAMMAQSTANLGTVIEDEIEKAKAEMGAALAET